MRPVAWAALGFVAGAGATAAVAAAVWPEAPADPVAALPALAPSAVVAPSAALPPAAAEASEPAKKERRLLTHDPLMGLDATARVAIMRWMAANADYEFITRDYCNCHYQEPSNCPPFEEERLRVQSKYPYSSVRDFNEDGQKDFALMVAKKGVEGPALLVVFNGPFGDDVPKPALTQSGWEINDHVEGGFIGPPESDDGYVLKKKAAGYELDYVGDDGG